MVERNIESHWDIMSNTPAGESKDDKAASSHD